VLGVSARLIGVSGKAMHGKDTVGAILSEKRGYTRMAFADKLKELTVLADPLILCGMSLRLDRLSAYVRAVGMDAAKKEAEVRRLLQALGHGAREIFGEDAWVDALFRQIDSSPGELGPGFFVVTDVRYPNEAEAVRRRGGEVWRIVRPDAPSLADPAGIHVSEAAPASSHASETALDDYDFDRVVLNDGPLSALAAKVLS